MRNGNRGKKPATRPRRAGGKRSAPPAVAAAPRPVTVVGIGASAGGLQALRAFFGALPADFDAAIVIVVHLDPTHESLMAELLGKTTGLRVEPARDRQPIEPKHVYVIPPKCLLTVEANHLRVRQAQDHQALRGVIDLFFRSLAESRAEDAIAILMSGSGTEGTLGARAIKAAGGLVMAQTPESASHASMPSSVIAAGAVDIVAAPDKLATTLHEQVKAARSRPRHPVEPATQRAEAGLPAVLGLLRARTKYDFRGYKQGTIQRRVERRMAVHQIGKLADYVEYLRTHSGEVDQLFRDMLIGVTSFFRDPKAFEELSAKVLAPLVRERDPDLPIRIWVPGCSTGEEAYSIAIALAEQIAEARTAARVQIFATDVDEEALEVARAGSYGENIAIDVTPERLRRFFTREDHRYVIAKPIRETVIFAVQNLIGDPPFSRLDLVSCRNVLIYLEPDLQRKLMAVFHFALRPGGYLFLGSAEGVGASDELFTPLSKTQRVFRRTGPISRTPLELPRSPGAAAETAAVLPAEPSVVMLADQELLKNYSPPAVVVRSNGDILRFYGALDRYIRFPSGEITFDVHNLARDALKPTLRAALAEAVRRNRPTSLETLEDVRGRERSQVRITVKPMDAPKLTERYWLILFEEINVPPRETPGARGKRQPDLVRRLELELRATKKEQQYLIEQLESGTEELKAANEEVLSMNEELQSTNEELTTSKEELQSMNEELTTLNAQLQDKVHELTTVNDDLANLLMSTDIATVFLDTDLHIKRFTTAASRVLNLRPTDVARPMNHIAPNLVDADVPGDAARVLASLQPIEKEVAARDGRHYFLRGLPYRTSEKQVEGVVLTFVDITALKESESALRSARERVSEELRRMTRLHELGNRLGGPDTTRNMLEEPLRAALDITDAQFGNIQLGNPEDGLTIAAQVGFEPPFLEHFAHVAAKSDSTCGQALAERSRILVENVAASPVFDGTPSQAVMLAAGVQAVQSTPLLDRSGRFLGVFSTHYREPHHFEAEELRWLDLLARQAADLVERQHASEVLEQRVIERTQWLRLTHDVSRSISEATTWEDALQNVLHRLCEIERWELAYVYLPDPDVPDALVPAFHCLLEPRLAPFHSVAVRKRHAKGEPLPGRVFTEGVPIWANDAEELYRFMTVRGDLARQSGLKSALVMPILLNREVVAVVELLSDHHHAQSEHRDMLMRDVCDQVARLFERERATARTADLLWREQQELLHTLHDSLGQTLTGLGMLSTGLRERLAGSAPAEANTAAEIARQAKEAVGQVRQLTRSLFPVEVEAGSLMAALRDLAAATESLHNIHVRVEGQAPATMRDGATANQLYRIAQEAVTNSVKHAHPRTVTIKVAGDPTFVQLKVIDDGIGIPHPTPGNGMGLKIMKYRANSIGGKLTVEPGTPSGTMVSCIVRARVVQA